MTHPPRLPHGWQWRFDRFDDWMVVNLYSPTKCVISQKIVTAGRIRVWFWLRLYVLLGIWVEIAGRRIGNWLYRTFNKDKRKDRRIALAIALDGDWDSRGRLIDE